MPSFEPVRAVQRGLAVLRSVSESGPLTATDLVKQTGLPQPTVIRLLETLIDAGYIFREPGTMTYGVTAQTQRLSRGFNAHTRLAQLAEPLIEELRSKIGWPSNLAIIQRGTLVVAYTNRNANGMVIPGLMGQTLPLLATGVGLVSLAHMPAETREVTLAALRKGTNRWDAESSLWENLDERLQQIRLDGHAFANETYLAERYGSRIWAVAVPITVNGDTVAAISSLVLRNAGSRKRLLASILPALRRTADRIAGLLAKDTGITA
jgi:IclR family mhp operon transcriptional activator